MSTSTKAILWVVAAVIVVGGIWWWLGMSPSAVAPTNSTAMQTPTSTSGNDTGNAQGNGVSATDSSNAALQTDLSNIDTQMNGFSSDNASVTQGLNDQPVQQASL